MKLRLKRIRELFGYAARLVREEGPGRMLRRAAGFFRRRLFARRARYLPAKRALAAQRAAARAAGPDARPLISVCVPLYNTPPRFLADLLDGMIAQTSPWWQLCLADASDEGNDAVGQLVAKKATEAENKLPPQTAPRIVYTRIENKGISANTNAAAALADGEYLALADHDDILAPHAIYTMQREIMASGAAFLYSDEALFTRSIRRPGVGHFKPDYAPDYLLCCNYLCHLAVFLRSEFEAVGGERPELDGAQDHDLFFRLLERIPPQRVRHVPEVLYYWRVHGGSTSGGVEAKPYVAAAARRAIAEHLARTGRGGEVMDGLFPSTYRVLWPLEAGKEPLVSVIIPNKDHAADLARCLESLTAYAGRAPFELLVVENNSAEPETFAFYEEAKRLYPNLRVLTCEGPFNFSAVNNFGRAAARGSHLLLLNNDIEVLSGGFLDEMLMFSQRPDVGCVGAKLYYPDDKIQHAGVFLGINGTAGHSHKSHPRASAGDMYRLATAQNMTAVTGACLMVKAELYDAAGGLDAEHFAVAYNDIDLCLKLWQRGLWNVFTPFAEAYHYESKSRGLDESGPNAERYAREKQNFIDKYGPLIEKGDPFYNPHFNLLFENYGLK